jgi:selenocysteine-specific elongation factor
MKYFIVGTAGHVDHGKSALVKALTGTDPDRWEEEKRRGITIDLGFAELDLGGGVHAGFVDVPGHERFVKNMLVGAGGMDMVLLVIAADEAIKPQTREHFDICRLLGIERGVVAITKSDLVAEDVLGLVTLEIQEFVAGTFLEGAPIVAVSSHTGAGLEKLCAELQRVGLESPPKPSDLPARLPIDRAFIIKGFGTVVTGTLVAGRIEKEQELEILPLGRRARVRGIQVHNRAADSATAGQRTALNLAAVDAHELERGMVLAPPGMFQATSRLDVRLELLPFSRAMKTRTRVHFHSGTTEALATVVLLDQKDLAPGAGALAQLRLSKPGLYLPGDRFIIRQFSPLVTLGGGLILANDPPRYRAGDTIALQELAKLKTATREERVEWHVRQDGEATIASLVARTGLLPQDILSAARGAALKDKLRALGQPPIALVHETHYTDLRREIETQLASFHAANPLLAGISREELRARLGRKREGKTLLPSNLLVGALLQDLLAQSKIIIEGETVRLAGRGSQLTPEESAARDQIAQAFERAGLAVPDAKQVLSGLKVDRARAEKILKILLKEGTLIRVNQDLIFHAQALARLREMVVRRKTLSNRIDVAVFKEITGLSRKYAIPLLEYLDREHVTRRVGDERIIL